VPVLKEKSREAFVLMRAWIKQQFDALSIADSDGLAMDYLAKLQGVSLLGCAFKDSTYIDRGHRQINEWIDSKVSA